MRIKTILAAVLAILLVAGASGQAIAAAPGELLYTDSDVKMIAKTVWAEARGIPDQDQQAAVVWCILNRVDDPRWEDTIAEVLTAPHQFAYYPDSPVTEDLLRLAEDVLEQWRREKAGEIDVGRVLPSDYVFFDGDGQENYFRRQFEHTGEYWDWTLNSYKGECAA